MSEPGMRSYGVIHFMPKISYPAVAIVQTLTLKSVVGINVRMTMGRVL